MSRKIRFIAIALAVSALMAASAQAAPARLTVRDTPVVGRLASTWDWLVSVLQGNSAKGKPPIKRVVAEDTSHLDPNGNH